jgi:uncharacterized protein YjbI with pentapeptide repeats
MLAAFPFAAVGIEVGINNLLGYQIPLAIILTITLPKIFSGVNHSFWYTSFVVIFLGLILGFLILKKSEEYMPSLLKGASILAATRGTSFRSVDLTGANFLGAVLKSTDFRWATITNVDWSSATSLKLARFGGTNLQNPLIQEIVTTRELAKSCDHKSKKKTSNDRIKNYDGVDFEGVNLEGVNLKGVSLIRAKLNYANLRSANLTGAILKQAQLDGADLTGAILTGAFIECWGVTSSTKLDKIECEHVFMRVQTAENPNPLRKPDNENRKFLEGEFSSFIQPYFDTLDLYHSQNIDPRCISIALKNLESNNPDAQLKFVAIEWRGDGLNIRYTTMPGIDKSKLDDEYFTDYAQISKGSLDAIKQIAADKDAEIIRIKNLLIHFLELKLLKEPVTHQTIYIAGDIQVKQNSGINFEAGGNIGDISGDVTNRGIKAGNNSFNNEHWSDADLLSFDELLSKLRQVIQADTDLSDVDKSDLLEQIDSLALAKKVEVPVEQETLVRKAKKIFEGTLRTIPDTAKIVEACSKLLPIILRFFDFPGT